MKVFITTDWHYGVYTNNLDKWLDMMDNYFYNSFIPYIKQNYEDGDILVHCGDLYDNRTSIPIIVSYKVERVLVELSKILPVHIIVGNHDLWNKGSNDVNSVRLFNHIDNINVYTETTTIDVFDKKLVLMPWVEKRLDLINELRNNKGDYLFCHSDLNGCRMHLNSVAHRNPDKIDVEEFGAYKHVFSGHIHIRQSNKNFTFIGSPYQMDRNDMGDQKGITILDLSDGVVKFEPNKYSPVFKKIKVSREEDIDGLDILKNSKDYIDLLISNSLLVNNRKLRRKLETLLESNTFSTVEYVDDIVVEKIDGDEFILESNDDSDVEGVSIQLEYEDYIKEYILKQKYDTNETKNGLLKEFDEVIKIYNENYKSKNS
jgi:DNA repair exonuclease SbcCD nuclease subunit